MYIECSGIALLLTKSKAMNEENIFVGRHPQRKELLNLCQSRGSDLVSVTGRRRVGKTFLIKQTLGPQGIDFSLAGVQNGSLRDQLLAFEFSLAAEEERDVRLNHFEDFQIAFIRLIEYLRTRPKNKKLIVFLDELPWLATPKSGFLRAFSFFWNNWAVDQNILVIICGSAASWMIRKVVKDKAGLHNRITRRLSVDPFTLGETQEYLAAKGLVHDQRVVLELYMALGGIPFYLRALKPGLTPAQNIDSICLDPNGALRGEFENLYPALFERADRHVRIVTSLAGHPHGLTRRQLLEAAGMKDGGSFTKALEELVFSGFLVSYASFNKRKRGKVYRLLDEFSLFYLRFIKPLKGEGTGVWTNLRTQPTYHSWAGYAFENVGLRHYPQIKKALGIAGVQTRQSTFYHPGDEHYPGFQIDLIIDRADNAINLCEFKHSQHPVRLSSDQLERMEQRRDAFAVYTGSDKMLFNTLVVAPELSRMDLAGATVQGVVRLDDLFG